MSVIYTPGHTPNGLTFFLGGAAAVGDTLFAGSLGRAHRGPAYYDRLLSSARRILVAARETWLCPDTALITTVEGREARQTPFVADASATGGSVIGANATCRQSFPPIHPLRPTHPGNMRRLGLRRIELARTHLDTPIVAFAKDEAEVSSIRPS